MTTADDTARVRVGHLATAAGLTVRALHHYEEIGLLRPSDRSEAGHRLYDTAAVARLYRILRLRDLGMPLDRIGQLLDDAGTEPGSALRSHAADIDAEIDRLVSQRDRVANALSGLAAGADRIDDWMEVLAAMDERRHGVRQRISILVYRDLGAAHDHLVRVFGMTPGEIHRDPDGNVVHAEVFGGDGRIWLHPESDTFALASPATLGRATATMAIMVDDVDAHHRSVVAHGGDIVYEPVDQPYGYREYGARDPEGTLWSFMRALAA